jgi:hypothetical protein
MANEFEPDGPARGHPGPFPLLECRIGIAGEASLPLLRSSTPRRCR